MQEDSSWIYKAFPYAEKIVVSKKDRGKVFAHIHFGDVSAAEEFF